MPGTVAINSLPRISPLAGKPAPKEMLIDVAQLQREYFERRPDVNDPNQMVSFGTSGHRGSALDGTFNEAHILAITQAICDYRRANGTDGPLHMGKDTHAVSEPAERTALEVLAANNVDTVIQRDNGVTPTPVISRAILAYNRSRDAHFADGIVITPSHNPPRDGGFKYNPPNGGPADTDVTRWVENRANELLRAKNVGVKRVPFTAAFAAPTTHKADFAVPYIRDLQNVVDMDAIRGSGIRIAVDPLGGASEPYWGRINNLYRLDVAVVNTTIDHTFSFMTVDHDGVIRMDCSIPYAMARLVELKDRYRVAFGNDTDADRHGVVTPSAGLMNPNRYLAVAIRYLLTNRPQWPKSAVVGKTLVSSSMIDKVVQNLGRHLYEVPVGFKWFVSGFVDGSCCFGGEESAGASFLRCDGNVWTTDKDGLIMNLLAAEITARTGKDPGEHYAELTAQFGTPLYTRIDVHATPEQKSRLRELSPNAITASSLAGEPIVEKLTRSPGDNAPIGGLKVVTAGRLVCRAAFRDRGHLQDLRGELQGSGAPRRNSERGRRDCECGAGVLEEGDMTTDSAMPFRQGCRASGILLHVTSLPSAYGIGDLGPTSLSWVDRLVESGQTWWQALPLGPTGYGNSPYQPLSSFAGNELVISPDWLIEDGLLRSTEIQDQAFPASAVDYNAVVPFKRQVLEKAWANFRAGARADLRVEYEQFRNDQAHWLNDYALFRALKIKFAGVHYLEWPGELVNRVPAALDHVRNEVGDWIDLACFIQFLLFRQTDRLKAYAHARGLSLIGDLPFFVSPDSSDVWADPELFLLDDRCLPSFVAGVPPDYFSAKASSGAIPSTIGLRFRRPVINGGSIVCARCSLTSTWFVSIISGDSPLPGISPRAHRQRGPEVGFRGRARTSSRRPKRDWTRFPSWRKTWG